MRWFFTHRRLPSFALLGKELIELAGQKRTYLLRCSFVFFLLVGFLIVCGLETEAAARKGSLMAMYRRHGAYLGMVSVPGIIGHGRPLLDLIYWTLSGAILLIMPTVSAVAITREKEQGSLTTLLLTSMGPWEILLQKYLSGVIAMGSFILLALPLFAICFEMGGVEVNRVWGALYLLMLTCLQTGAVCLAMSSWCRSSMVSICMSVATLAILYLGQPVALQLMNPRHDLQGFFSTNFINFYYMGSTYGNVYSRNVLDGTPCICPLISYAISGLIQVHASQPRGTSPCMLVLINSFPALISIPVFLGIARFALIARADITGMNPMLRGMLALDRYFIAIDAKMGRKSVRDLPVQDPVAWRELNRRSLANWRYLIRIFLPIGVLLLIAMSYAGLGVTAGGSWLLSMITMSVPVIAAALMLIMGTGILTEDRTQQSLEVLLSTPLTAREIVVQKVRAFRRIHGACLMLMLMACLVRWVFLPGYHGSAIVYSSYYLVTGLVMLPAVLWLGVLSGILIPGRTQSVIAGLVCVAVWLGAIPLVLLAVARYTQFAWAPSLGSQCYWIATHMSPIFAFLEIRDQGEYYLRETSSLVPSLNQDFDDQWMVGLTAMTTSCLLVWGGAALACRRLADKRLRRGSSARS